MGGRNSYGPGDLIVYGDVYGQEMTGYVRRDPDGTSWCIDLFDPERFMLIRGEETTGLLRGPFLRLREALAGYVRICISRAEGPERDRTLAWLSAPEDTYVPLPRREDFLGFCLGLIDKFGWPKMQEEIVLYAVFGLVVRAE